MIIQLSLQWAFLNQFYKVVFGGVTPDLQEGEQNHAQNTYFHLCGNFTELFPGKPFPILLIYNQSQNCKHFTTLLCDIILLLFFFPSFLFVLLSVLPRVFLSLNRQSTVGVENYLK